MEETAERAVPEIIGGNIRLRRKAKGWTQRKLAEVVGTTSNQVAVWERGEARPSDRNLEALSRELGCRLADLFGEVEGGAA